MYLLSGLYQVPVLQNHKLVNTAVKSHLYKKILSEKEYAKKRVRNMLFIFYKGKKNRHHTSHRFFLKTSCIFCWTWESLPAGTVAATPRHSALSTEPSHAIKTWIQEKAQNHAPPAFPNINNNQRSGKKKKKKNKKTKTKTKKGQKKRRRRGQECH